MTLTYDPKTDTLTLTLSEGTRIEETDELEPGVLVDLDPEGRPVRVEILDLSKRIADAKVGGVPG